MSSSSRVGSPIPQPFLHDLVTCVYAPTAVLSDADGQIRPGGVQGAFRHDRRVVSALWVDVDGHEPTAVGQRQPGADSAHFVSVVRHLGDPGADPTVRLERTRRAGGDGFDERVVLVNASRRGVSAEVRVRIAADLAVMDTVKHGESTTAARPDPAADGATWTDRGTQVRLHAGGGPDVVPTERDVALRWQVSVPPGGWWSTDLTLTAVRLGPEAVGTFAPAPRSRPVPATVTGPPDLTRLISRGLADLTALTLADSREPGDHFAAAGSPWFLTLFGRDSLWSARFTLPLGTDLARGTLGALSRRQGTRHDPDTGEAPGKIPHEVRSLPQRATGGHLVYYGTVDATALWVCLLHDAWRWGMPAGDVAQLLPSLRAALRWLVTDADADGDGFLEYVDHAGAGLANQGWKDSADSIQFVDGTIAAPPIALCEAQAYAYEAATHGADLLDAFDQPGGDELRSWAAALRARFREVFWVEDGRGRFPAIALEGAKRPVGVAASNIGHLLGTGLLSPAEAATVTARLAEPDLDCGYGLRTLSADAAGFNPLGYHIGTVWPHDTAITVLGMVREGQTAVARSLADALLRASPSFDHRLPELYAGTDARAGEAPLAYPAACRPQAWSAAAAVVLLQAALGLEADVPGGTLTIRPQFPSWLPLSAPGLRVAGHPLSVAVDGGGQVRVETTAPVRVQLPDGAGEPSVPHLRQATQSGDRGPEAADAEHARTQLRP
jgi:glycogen debranching enzyme